jgi:alpha-L-fucosidase
VFEPHPRSLRRHRVPPWFEDAKLGIFIHWTLAAVPAWAPNAGSLPELIRDHFADSVALSPYAEWYWMALNLPGSPTARHHAATYGDAPYEDFRRPFEAMLERWDPAPWAELFAESGARYVVHVTKHHDGYCLWPTRHESPRKPGWHAKVDVVGGLAAAVRARGLRFGVYYSGGLDWAYEPRPIRNLAEMITAVPLSAEYAAYVDAHYRELIERCAPDVLWNDIAYPPGPGLWRLLADYYEALPEGVVNDRFLPAHAVFNRLARLPPLRALVNFAARRIATRPGFTFAPPPPPHRDFRTPEYASFAEIRREKWEATRGIGHSFGHNRNEPEGNFIEPDELVRSFVDIVSKNGNLLLNVGPSAEGEIPEIQASRLRALGAWLRANGAAIYGTRPWTRAEGRTREGIALRFTARRDALYAIALGRPPGPTLTLCDVDAHGAELLGHGPLDARPDGNDLTVSWPSDVPVQPAYALELTSAEGGSTPPAC